jgi:hypothetical protein
MRFKVDENLPVEIVLDLRMAGHDAESVPAEDLGGALDRMLLERVQQEQRALLTLDKGIANIRVYPPDQYHGLVLFRLKTSGRRAVVDFCPPPYSGVSPNDFEGPATCRFRSRSTYTLTRLGISPK